LPQTDPLLGALAEAAAKSPPQTDSGKELLSGLTGAEQQVNIDKASQFYNLVDDLDPSKAKDIGRKIKKGFDTDNDSRDDWLRMHEFWLRQYMQTDAAMNSDETRDWGATESVPIVTEACDQFQSRTYKAFFPNETFVSAVPQRHSSNPEERKTLEERADRVGKHMSWQLGVQNPEYKRDKRALFLAVALHGSFFTKTYFDIKKKRVCVDNVRPTDLIINYAIGPVSIKDCRRKSHIIHTTVGETDVLALEGYISSGCKPDDGSQSVYDEAVDEAQGLTPDGSSSDKSDRPATLVEQQFYLDIDDSGIPKPYLGTIDLVDGDLKRLTIDWEADPSGQPLNDYEQIQYYTHYKFAENPDGFYGLGLGAKIGDLAAAASIAMRQLLDAATLANDGNNSGYISSRLCMDGEDDVTLTIGKLKKIPDTTGDLQQGIMMMKFPGPSEALYKCMEFLDQRAQRIAGTTEATTGSIEKNMQPTTVLAQIEQGLELFSSVQMGLADDFGDELWKIYKLNQRHLPLVEYFSINEVPEAITRADYADDMAIQPIFDPKFATQQQKMARAQATGQIIGQNPFLAQNPMIANAVTRRQLEAMDIDNVEELVPPPPPPPANIDNQDAENMYFLQPPEPHPPFAVYPDQHHAEHLAQLESFVQTHGTKIPPEQQQAVVQHKQMHESFLYGQQKGLIPPPQPRGAPPMANGPGNGMVPQADGSQIPALPGLASNPLTGANSLAQLSGGLPLRT
jgi:chaperonin GroES